MENILYRFLTKINVLVECLGLKAQKEIPLIFNQMLQAEGCAIYMFQEGDYVLQHEYSSIPFHQTWRQYAEDVPLSVQYLDEPEKLESILDRNTWARALILPLPGDIGTKGILLAFWTGLSPLDSLAPEDFVMWQPIATQLAVLYYWRSQVEQLRQREESLALLFQKVEQNYESSRKQIAQELHYEVGQTLTSIMLQIKLLEESNDLEYVQGRLGGIRHIVSQTSEVVQRLVRSQRSILLDKLGLPAALSAYVQEFTETTKIPVELVCPELTKRLPEHVETIVYRSVQEALSIGSDRGGFKDASLRLSLKGNNLFLQISYNGVGTNNGSGIGLLGLEERVRQAQGKYWVINQKEKNLCLNILLPLE